MTCNMIGHLIKLIISEVVCTWPIIASPEFVSHFFLFRSRYYLRLAILSVTLPNLIISEAVHTWLIISPEFYLWINLLSTNRNNIDARKQETPPSFPFNLRIEDLEGCLWVIVPSNYSFSRNGFKTKTQNIGFQLQKDC